MVNAVNVKILFHSYTNCGYLLLLLTLGAHALQSYNGVCVCVCVQFNFPNSNELTKKAYGSPQHCSRLIYNVFFFS